MNLAIRIKCGTAINDWCSAIHPIDQTERSKLKLFEGDIILEEADNPNGYRKRRQEGSVMGVASHIWPNKTVYYTFQTGLGKYMYIVHVHCTCITV